MVQLSVAVFRLFFIAVVAALCCCLTDFSGTVQNVPTLISSFPIVLPPRLSNRPTVVILISLMMPIKTMIKRRHLPVLLRRRVLSAPPLHCLYAIVAFNMTKPLCSKRFLLLLLPAATAVISAIVVVQTLAGLAAISVV